MDKNKQATIWAGISLTMIVLGVLTYMHQLHHNGPIKDKSSMVNTVVSSAKGTVLSETTVPTTSDVSSATSTPTSSPASIYNHKKSVAKTPLLNYGETVNLYVNSRIQFNSLCQAIPGQVVFANFTTIMLDNRSDSPQKISIAGQTYVVAAYNYVLVTLKQKTLPTTLHVSCNNQMNSVEIIVE